MTATAEDGDGLHVHFEDGRVIVVPADPVAGEEWQVESPDGLHLP